MRGEKLRGQKEKLLKTDALHTCEETGRKKIKGIKTNTITKRLQRGFRARLLFQRSHSRKGIKETQNSAAAGFHENESSN